MTQGTALQTVNAAAIQRAGHTQMVIQPAVILQRAELHFFADMIEAADLIPYDKNVTKPIQKARVMAKIVGGAAHGFDPISSQENMHVIQGRCVLAARGMAVKFRRTGRYDTRIEKLDSEGCILAILHLNDEGKWMLKGRAKFMQTDADKAGLLTSNAAMYKKWDEDMYYANAMKRAVRRFAPEVLDTSVIDYRLSKESAAADRAAEGQQQPLPQSRPQMNAAPEGIEDAGELEEYVDQPYVESGIEDDEIESEVVEENDELQPLRDEANRLLNEKIGDDAPLRKSTLKGRVIENMTADELQELIGDLDAI